MKYLFLIVIAIFLSGCTEVVDDGVLASENYSHHLRYGADCDWIKTDYWLPDPECSPGDAFPLTTIQIKGKYAQEPGGVIVGDICIPGYSANIRDVSQKTKEAVYKKYGVVSRVTGEYEMDHIIPLAIGGTNEVANLFPQPALPKPGFHQKDMCEVCFKNMVCRGELDIKEAQDIMAKNWTRCLVMCGVEW